MSNAAKLKKRAVELEQKKQFDKALALYVQFLQESDGALDDIDVPLYNRVGDLMLRVGNTSDALNYYEKAVDLYAERGFLNNAIALCNKVLRQSPGRSSIYYKLGKISATKGFKSDAKKNFLEYADRMQKAGQIDEAFRALKEFADLCPDQDDIRLMLAEQLSKENRQGEALEQLQKLHDKLDSEGRTAEARATVDRMKAIDPDAVPRTSGSYPPQKSSDLIFLDTSYEQGTRARPPVAPATRQVSDPDLVVLTLADQADVPISPVHNAAVADAFALDIGSPAAPTAPTADLPLLDVDDVAGALEALPAADDDRDGGFSLDKATGAESAGDGVAPLDLDVPSVDTFDLPADADVAALDAHLATRDASAGHATAPEIAPLDLTPEADLSAVDAAVERPNYVSGPPLGVDYAGDLVTDLTLPAEAAGGDLFDFRSPPRTDDDALDAAPLGTLDPDVSFPSFDLGDTALPSADEITSGGNVAAALGAAASLGDELDDLELPAAAGMVDLPADDDPAAASESAGLEVDLPAPADTLSTTYSAPVGGAVGIDELELVASEEPRTPSAARDEGAVAENPPPGEPWNARELAVEDDTPHVDAVAPVESLPTSPSTTPPAPSWDERRAHAERLLEMGDRAAGVLALEQMAVGLERAGDLEGALTIIDELIRLTPDSVGHHQKRVELAFRASDRAKLINAYIELGDALFRSGEEQKARAVYQRVLELAPEDARARAALDSVASMSPPAGSGAIAAPGATAAAPAPRAPTRVEQGSATAASNGAANRVGGSIAPSPSRKPSPLDRRAANAEFVDLGEWLRADESPKSTRMVAEEKPPTGDEQADFQEMLKRFKQGVADNVDEEDYESHYDLGVAFKEMGLMDEAVAEFQKALRGSAHRVRAYEALGQCFVEKEQYQVASSVLSRAIALGEGDDHHLVGVLYLLGRATEALNKHHDALDYYQRVFAVDIEFRDVAERISAIERKGT